MKPRSWRALAHIRRRTASATPIGTTAMSRPRTIQRTGHRVSARALRSSPSTHLSRASTEMRIEIDAARVGEIGRWTLERYKESFKRGRHIPFRDCAERPIVVAIADTHGVELDSPYRVRIQGQWAFRSTSPSCRYRRNCVVVERLIRDSGLLVFTLPRCVLKWIDARDFHHPADMPATAISFTLIREERAPGLRPALRRSSRPAGQD